MTTKWESPLDRQIREAHERGEFDNLPGAGKPLPQHGQPYDPEWWAKDLLRRENLPDAPALRKEIEALPARLARLRLESSVRDIVADLNNRIRQQPDSGHQVLNVEDVVRAWRAQDG
ncbi:MAG TPA: DUF1992 domain-containing protein [Pseudonocardiaceae bacterium]|jgi:hypothetical protein|nr:DUF1992 domain-containing protein [Pseudonocardiaceae bacterium]